MLFLGKAGQLELTKFYNIKKSTLSDWTRKVKTEEYLHNEVDPPKLLDEEAEKVVLAFIMYGCSIETSSISNTLAAFNLLAIMPPPSAR